MITTKCGLKLSMTSWQVKLMITQNFHDTFTQLEKNVAMNVKLFRIIVHIGPRDIFLLFVAKIAAEITLVT